MHKTLGNIILFLGSVGVIVNTVQFLARNPVTMCVFPFSVALLVTGSVLIRYSRRAEQA